MFYTYLHRRNDTGAAFYIGKGSSNRATSKSSRSRHWKAIVNAHGYTVEILAMWPTEQEAFDHEVFLIETFGMMGEKLINKTSGGDGISGHIHTDTTKQAMAASHRSRWTDELRLNLSIEVKKRMKNPEHKHLVMKAMRSGMTPELEAQRISGMAAAKLKPEVRRRMSEAQLIAQQRPEVRARQKLSRALSKTPGGKPARPVTCLTTGDRFDSASDASRYFGLHPSSVAIVCRGESKHKHGLHFAYSTSPSPVH